MFSWYFVKEINVKIISLQNIITCNLTTRTRVIQHRLTHFWRRQTWKGSDELRTHLSVQTLESLLLHSVLNEFRVMSCDKNIPAALSLTLTNGLTVHRARCWLLSVPGQESRRQPAEAIGKTYLLCRGAGGGEFTSSTHV